MVYQLDKGVYRMKTFKEALDITSQLINDIIFMCETRTKSTYFTRNGKMSFKSTILFILNFVKKIMKFLKKNLS